MPRALLPLLAAVFFAALPAAQERRRLTDGWVIAPEVEAGSVPADGWRAVTVPSTFEDVFGVDFDGVAWYRRMLPRRPEGARVRLLFRGAATDAEVRVGGEVVGGHLGAWTPWRVDVTERLSPDAETRLEVRVDEKVGHNTQGFLPVIQPHFGGLWQDVELCVDRGPRFDAERAFTFGSAEEGVERLHVEAPLLPGPEPRRVVLDVRLCDGARVVAETTVAPSAAIALGHGLEPAAELPAPGVRLWAPDRPHLYRVELELRDAETSEVLDRLERRVGFRDVSHRGTTLLWNGRPLQVRGMLHWGYSPPRFAPHTDPQEWRRQLEDVRALGCNMIKCCLWVPPRGFYEIADEIGLLVWQEYPTWHPQLTPEFLPELRREYEEFHAHDRSHPSVAFRSLTCETGHGADEGVLRQLYERCHELVPDTLVVDDSAWISWHRVHDFWDDHPYGNNSWWPGKLASFERFIAERRPLPLLFGECIAADTWFDRAAWDAAGLDPDAWWAPWGIDAQQRFEEEVEALFGRGVRDALLPTSLDYALRNRKYQIERCRMSLPWAGYTLSVIRDFSKARMGFYDDLERLKWSPEQWAWHGDTMLCLDTEADRRAFVAGDVTLPVRVVHCGRGPLRGAVTLGVAELGEEMTSGPLDLAEGSVSEPLVLRLSTGPVAAPRRLRVTARLSGTHPTENAWDVWVVPQPSGTLPREVRVVDALDRETLAALEQGARVLLRAGDRKGSLETSGIWFLKGAPIAPPHAIHAHVPPEMLLELQSFDLEVGRVMHGEQLFDEVDPVLAFWDTHDIRHVNRWLLAFTARVGRGRLAATTLNHDSPAGRYVLEHLAQVLVDGPAPRRGFTAETLESLRSALRADTVDLVGWELATDPEDRGLAAGWQRGTATDGDWRPVRAGAHWESQGFEHYDGVAWYRTTLEVPERWRGATVRAVFEGVDDSYRLYVDGEEVARHGDPEAGETVWLVRTVCDLSEHLNYGAANHVVLRVVDHNGAGGLHRPVFVTTGPVDPASDLLH